MPFIQTKQFYCPRTCQENSRCQRFTSVLVSYCCCNILQAPGLRTTRCTILKSWRSEVQNRTPRANEKALGGCMPGGPRRHSVLALCSCRAAHMPWLTAPSLRAPPPLSCFLLSSPRITPSLTRTTVTALGPLRDPGASPRCEIFLTHLQKSLVPCKETQILGARTRSSSQDRYCAYYKEWTNRREPADSTHSSG